MLDAVFWIAALLLIALFIDLARRLIRGEWIEHVGHWGGFGGGIGGRRLSTAAIEFALLIVVGSAIFFAGLPRKVEEPIPDALSEAAAKGAKTGVAEAAAALLEDKEKLDSLATNIAGRIAVGPTQSDGCAPSPCMPWLESENLRLSLANGIAKELEMRLTKPLADAAKSGAVDGAESSLETIANATAKASREAAAASAEDAAKDIVEESIDRVAKAARSGAQEGAEQGAQAGVSTALWENRSHLVKSISDQIAQVLISSARRFVEKEVLDSVRRSAEKGAKDALDDDMQTRLAHRVAGKVKELLDTERPPSPVSSDEFAAIVRAIARSFGTEFAQAIKDTLIGHGLSALPPYIRHLEVEFEFGDASILQPVREMLDETIADIDQQNWIITAVLVIGATDTAGEEKYNNDLAEDRNKNVIEIIKDIIHSRNHVNQKINNIKFKPINGSEFSLRRHTEDEVRDPKNRKADVFFILKTPRTAETE